jgi:hypothetical protein
MATELRFICTYSDHLNTFKLIYQTTVSKNNYLCACLCEIFSFILSFFALLSSLYIFLCFHLIAQLFANVFQALRKVKILQAISESYLP